MAPISIRGVKKSYGKNAVVHGVDLEIQSGEFARQWVAENKAGKPNYQAMWDADLEQPIEKVGAKLRQHMAWLQSQPDTKAA